MKAYLVVGTMVALALAPAASGAQAANTDARVEARAHGPGTHLLERLQAELNLSGEQVERLRAITSDLEERNRPLVAQLREAGVGPKAGARGARARAGGTAMTPEQREQVRERVRNMTPEQREQVRQRMGERTRGELPAGLEPVVQQVRANTRAAMLEARAVLTEEQRTRLAELTQERGRQAPRDGAARGWRR